MKNQNVLLAVGLLLLVVVVVAFAMMTKKQQVPTPLQDTNQVAPVEKTQVLLRKLRYPASQVNAVLAASRLWKDLPWVANAKFSMIANRLEDVPPLAIYANFLVARDEKLCNNFQAYFARLNTITPKITGNDLRERGLPPGPIYKRILGASRDSWLDGKIENVDQEETYLNELIRNETNYHPAS